MHAVARAHVNIALVKYWGKRDYALNLPEMGSLSVTLRDLYTETRVELVPGLASDELLLNGRRDARELARVQRFLDRVRERTGSPFKARVTSTNNFPTGAGLASSASGFAALALSATRAAGLELSMTELGALARLGSGSAPRSLFGGFVELKAGKRADGQDATAAPLAPSEAWPLDVVVVMTSEAKKEVSSSDGMRLSAATSPFYAAWTQEADTDLVEARAAIRARDFAALAGVAERNCLKMHAVMLTTVPALIYWQGATLEVVKAVRAIRDGGTPAFFTIDAGPQVKVICPPGCGGTLAESLAKIPGVVRVLTTRLGPEAALLEVAP